jgi:3-dehydroquinate synthase
LPAGHVRNGLAEAIKHAVIASRAEFEWLEANVQSLLRAGGPDVALAERLAAVHIGIKAGIVARDEREGGIRKVLNFGHTIGHAVETLSGYAMLHGECVAVGMVAETRVAEIIGVADDGLTESISALCRSAGLPTTFPDSMSAAAILAATRRDKKARAGAVEYALPSALGHMAGAGHGYGTPVPDAAVLEALFRSNGAPH